MLSILPLLLVLATAARAAPQAQNAENQYVRVEERALSEALMEALEKFRILMREGDPSKDIPIMDPYDINSFNFSFDTGLLSMDLDTADIQLRGLSDFIVHNIDFDMIRFKLKFDATMPLTVVHADKYKFTGMVFNALPIYGAGEAYFEIGNFYFKGSSKIAVGLSGVFLRDLDVEFFVESLLSKTTGMLGGGDIDNVINAIMADMAPEFFNKNSKLISEAISSVVLTKLNDVLDGKSLQDLIDLITG